MIRSFYGVAILIFPELSCDPVATCPGSGIGSPGGWGPLVKTLMWLNAF